MGFGPILFFLIFLKVTLLIKLNYLFEAEHTVVVAPGVLRTMSYYFNTTIIIVLLKLVIRFTDISLNILPVSSLI